jgi:Domain of unknown function (DUF4145)
VLVPRHVAAKHASANELSFIKNLQQAQEAFIFGTPYAALALMRSIMEAVLRDHYRAQGNDLAERINNARALPPLPTWLRCIACGSWRTRFCTSMAREMKDWPTWTCVALRRRSSRCFSCFAPLSRARKDNRDRHDFAFSGLKAAN